MGFEVGPVTLTVQGSGGDAAAAELKKTEVASKGLESAAKGASDGLKGLGDQAKKTGAELSEVEKIEKKLANAKGFFEKRGLEAQLAQTKIAGLKGELNGAGGFFEKAAAQAQIWNTKLEAGEARLAPFNKLLGVLGLSLDPVALGLAVLAAAIGAVIAVGVGLAACATEAADFTNEVNRASQQTGIAVPQMAALADGAGDAGLSIGDLSTALVVFNNNLTQAASGQGSSGAWLQALGVQLKDMQGNLRPTADLLGDVATALSKIPDGAQKSAAMTDLFGRSAKDLIPFINEIGRVGLPAFLAAHKEFSDLVGPQAVEAARAEKQAINELGAAWLQLKVALGQDVLPIFTSIVESLTSVLGWVNKNKQAILDYASAAGTALLIANPLTAPIGIPMAAKSAYNYAADLYNKGTLSNEDAINQGGAKQTVNIALKQQRNYLDAEGAKKAKELADGKDRNATADQRQAALDQAAANALTGRAKIQADFINQLTEWDKKAAALHMTEQERAKGADDIRRAENNALNEYDQQQAARAKAEMERIAREQEATRKAKEEALRYVFQLEERQQTAYSGFAQKMIEEYQKLDDFVSKGLLSPEMRARGREASRQYWQTKAQDYLTAMDEALGKMRTDSAQSLMGAGQRAIQQELANYRAQMRDLDEKLAELQAMRSANAQMTAQGQTPLIPDEEINSRIDAALKTREQIMTESNDRILELQHQFWTMYLFRGKAFSWMPAAQIEEMRAAVGQALEQLCQGSAAMMQQWMDDLHGNLVRGKKGIHEATLQMLSGVVSALGQAVFAKGMGAAAMGLFPPDPMAIAAGVTMMAIGSALMLAASAMGHGQDANLGGKHGGGSAPSGGGTDLASQTQAPKYAWIKLEGAEGIDPKKFYSGDVIHHIIDQVNTQVGEGAAQVRTG